jgi:hypothetical protein
VARTLDAIDRVAAIVDDVDRHVADLGNTISTRGDRVTGAARRPPHAGETTSKAAEARIESSTSSGAAAKVNVPSSYGVRDALHDPCVAAKFRSAPATGVRSSEDAALDPIRRRHRNTMWTVARRRRAQRHHLGDRLDEWGGMHDRVDVPRRHRIGARAEFRRRA